MKELAAETLMVGNVDLEFEGKKKIAVDLCDKADTFFSMDIIRIWFHYMLILPGKIQPTPLVLYNILESLFSWVTKLYAGHSGASGGCSICLHIAESSQHLRSSSVNPLKTFATGKTPRL